MLLLINLLTWSVTSEYILEIGLFSFVFVFVFVFCFFLLFFLGFLFFVFNPQINVYKYLIRLFIFAQITLR